MRRALFRIAVAGIVSHVLCLVRAQEENSIDEPLNSYPRRSALDYNYPISRREEESVGLQSPYRRRLLPPIPLNQKYSPQTAWSNREMNNSPQPLSFGSIDIAAIEEVFKDLRTLLEFTKKAFQHEPWDMEDQALLRRVYSIWEKWNDRLSNSPLVAAYQKHLSRPRQNFQKKFQTEPETLYPLRMK